jgi:FeS assembly SUF system protein
MGVNMDQTLIEKRKIVIDSLKTIYDPEVPLNIWDLGLVYGVDVTSEGVVTVVMTLTSPNCPAIDILPQQIEDTVESLDFVTDFKLNLVWDPPWDKTLMSEEARLELGML